jgi:hypothetical protein
MNGASSSKLVPGQAVRPLYAPPVRLATSNSSGSTTERKPFDDSDERVYFDRQGGTWRCEVEGDAGVEEVEWDSLNRAWIPVLGEEALRAQQAAYSVAGVDEEVSPIRRRREVAATHQINRADTCRSSATT